MNQIQRKARGEVLSRVWTGKPNIFAMEVRRDHSRKEDEGPEDTNEKDDKLTRLPEGDLNFKKAPLSPLGKATNVSQEPTQKERNDLDQPIIAALGLHQACSSPHHSEGWRADRLDLGPRSRRRVRRQGPQKGKT